MRFADILCPDAVKQQLLQSARLGRFPHAVLFSGKAGYGTLATALAMIQFLQCEEPLPDDSCGQCAACRKCSKLIHPDLHLAFPVTSGKKKLKSETMVSDSWLSEWREMVLGNPYATIQTWLEVMEADKQQGKITAQETRNILQRLSLRTGEGKFKIQLVWQAEKLQLEANRLLKVIEEPTENTLFFLITDQMEEILPTVISRVQVYKFPPLSEDQLSSWLESEAGGSLKPQRARQLAELSEGDLNELQTLLRENEDDLSSWFIRWMQSVMRLVFDADPTAWADLYAYLDQLTKMPLEQQKGCLRFGIRLVQNGFHAHMKTGPETTSVPERWIAIAGPELSRRTAEMLQQLHYALERNANARIAFTASSFQWARTIHSYKTA